MEKIVSIGALGGSGTRAVAKILMECGIYIGDRLNAPLDNLVFGSLFRQPDLFDVEDNNEIYRRLELFEEYMKNDRLSIGSVMTLRKKKKLERNFSKSFYLNQIFRKNKERELWGWKEPNTHFYLREAANFFKHFKYIHVLRNGLDMAFSSNKNQLKNWGDYYAISYTGNEREEELAVKQLDFWIQTTHEVIRKRDEHGIDVHLLRHEELCQNPVSQVKDLFEFLEVELNEEKVRRCAEIPRVQDSEGRYRKYDPNIFREDR